MINKLQLKKKRIVISSGMTSFVIVFVIQIVMNLFVKTMRSLPDEIGAIALAAKSVGYDWSYVLTHPTLYYGNATFPFLYPFFKLIKDPIILYQCLLGVGALLRSIPSIICCRILEKYFGIKDRVYLIICGIISVFIMPTRASNIDNEPILILLTWLILYNLIILIKMQGYKKEKYSITLAILLNISLLAHTRALIFTLVLFVLILIYYGFQKKWLVNWKVFGPIYVLSYIIVRLCIKWCTSNLFPAEAGEPVKNTSGALVSNIASGFKWIVNEYGLQSGLDLLCSNWWIIFVFSGGVLSAVMIQVIVITFSKRTTLNDPDTYYLGLYGTIGLLSVLAALIVLWINSAIIVHSTQEGNVSRGHFYLRYYALFFSPLILSQLVEWYRSEKLIYFKRVRIVCLFILILSVEWCLSSFLIEKEALGLQNMDWFYYFAPLSGRFQAWIDAKQNYSYFRISTLMAIGLFILLGYFIKYHRRNWIVYCYSLFLIYQYVYGVFIFDKPYASSEHYYKAADALYKCKYHALEMWNGVDDIYYINSRYGPQYIVQFILLNNRVILEYPPDDKKEAIILTDKVESIDMNHINSKDYKYTILDENETILIKGKELQQRFADRGYHLDYIP